MHFKITLAIFASIMSIWHKSTTAWAELCMQGSYPVLLGGNKGNTYINQIAYFEATARIAAVGDTRSTDIFDTNSVIPDVPFMALYNENSTDIPIWSKGLMFSKASPTHTITGVAFNTNGKYIVAHALNLGGSD